MGNFTFRWDHPANEVYVTGTFDGWAKSVKLERKGDSFEKTVEMPESDEKTLYKFVVDGNWTTDHTVPSERDDSGITNNVLFPKDIKPSEAAPHTMSSAAPQSTTAQLAGEQPKEPRENPPSQDNQPDKDTSEQALPGAFPETPAQESEQIFGVSPMPATAGFGNPIHLQPGEKVPHPSTLTGNTVENTVSTDKASYENSGGAPQLGPVVTPESERSAKGGMFSLPLALRNMIPESSLPMDTKGTSEPDPGVTIQSAAPASTTAQLAGQVPKEPRDAPDTGVTTQSAAPESSTAQLAGQVPREPRDAPDTDATTQSAAPESTTAQLAGQVPRASRDAPDTDFTTQSAAPESTSAQLAGQVPKEPRDAPDTDFTTRSAAPESTTAQLAGQVPKEPRGVPAIVKESQQEAEVDPEASESADAVQKKAEVERQILDEVQKDEPIPEGGPVGGHSAVNPEIQKVIDNMNARAGTTLVPDVVTKSISKADQSPEAAANPEAVQEKAAVESELLREVERTDRTGEPAPTAAAALSETAPSKTTAETPSALSPNSMSDTEPLVSSTEQLGKPGASANEAAPFTLPLRSGLNAPADAPAQSVGTDAGRMEPEPEFEPSRDVSPMSQPATQSPLVTTGVASSNIEPTETPAAGPVTPQKQTIPAAAPVSFTESAKGTPDSARTSESGTTSDRKSKRRSFFGRLKDKLK